MKLFKKRILKPISVLMLSIALTLVGIIGIYDYIIPDSVSYFEGDDLPVFMYAEAASLDFKDDISCAEYRLFDFADIV
jgi:hypothetical protein